MDAKKSFYANLGKRIRNRRQQAKITQDELAQRLSVTRTSVTNIESGRQRILVHSLYDIAQALGVPPASLLPPINMRGSDFANEHLQESLGAGQNEWIKKVLLANGES
ncbi:MAG TPA: helix-turn-helix transcriptional regulator [Blastocatellia bacterium]|nr:helix-turn-helix transcriptional regulator [Blastocatellia bacterium]